MHTRTSSQLASLPTSYFALVMATGIVSIAAFQHDLDAVAVLLLTLNVVFAVVLSVLYVARLIRYHDLMRADLFSEAHAPGYLTIAAAINVLGSGFMIIEGWLGVAEFLWAVGLVAWVLLMYSIFFNLTVAEKKVSLERGLNGTWLLLVVATQSVAVLGATIAPHLSKPEGVLFVSLLGFGSGFLLYMIVITLVCYRWWFLPMSSSEATPSYWVNMGALAITTLAGSNLVLAADEWTLTEQLQDFVTGLTVVFWSFATFWIPLLVCMGVWRHLVKRVPLRYSAELWAMVFPLGMYAAATFQMDEVLKVNMLGWLSWTFLVIALIAWVVTLILMVRSTIRGPVESSESRVTEPVPS